MEIPRKTTLEQALTKLPGPNGEFWSTVLSNGGFEVEIYAPRKTDRQTPHTRDEVYIIVSGTGEFTSEGRKYSFGPHDLFYVPAGAEHRFTNFSNDFVVWAIFFEPQ